MGNEDKLKSLQKTLDEVRLVRSSGVLGARLAADILLIFIIYMGFQALSLLVNHGIVAIAALWYLTDFDYSVTRSLAFARSHGLPYPELQLLVHTAVVFATVFIAWRAHRLYRRCVNFTAFERKTLKRIADLKMREPT
ncbi:hypothetical protein [Roseospira visakhapatnamensis]|uniref:Uncharacterized protein n=1 Tax=Roseospira visakhapatnamensis TaxID=390880 RepID=A0A7W6R9P8_9PROT|nr:hypothetical protein [Roseospira visakhapatnamensis]MBB4264473.1 hypothetical protein [Roseospira visakhapatnamensis]